MSELKTDSLCAPLAQEREREVQVSSSFVPRDSYHMILRVRVTGVAGAIVIFNNDSTGVVACFCGLFLTSCLTPEHEIRTFRIGISTIVGLRKISL